MKFKELKKSLSGGVKPIYLVCGEDAFFLERSVKLITDVCLGEPDLNLSVFDGAEVRANASDALVALNSFPFMSEKRVVIIKEYYPLAAELSKFNSYFQDPSDNSVLLIVNSANSDKIAKLPNVTFVDCAKGDESVLSAYIYGEGRRNQVVFTKEAVDKMIEYCNSDMSRISGETEKLIAYAADTKIVTEKEVEEICSKDEEQEVFRVVDFIADKRYDEAYTALTGNLRESGDSQRLFVSLYYHFRRLLYVSASAESDAEIAGYLKTSEYVVKKARRQAKKFTPKRLMRIVDALGKYDDNFKRGIVDQTSAVWNGILTVLAG